MKMARLFLSGLVMLAAVLSFEGVDDASEDSQVVSLLQEQAGGSNVAQCYRLKSLVRSNGLRDG